MNLKKKYTILIILIISIVLMGGFLVFSERNYIEFKENPMQLEINSDYDPMSFISKVHKYDISDVKIKENTIKNNELGEYYVVYSVKDYTRKLKVEVVDTIAPEFDVINLKTDTHSQLKPENLVKNIKDQTKTKVYFNKDYDFSKIGHYDVEVIVEDISGNKTSKKAQVDIMNDKEKPTLIGLHDFVIKKGEKVDYLKSINAKDNFDPKPKITVNSENVNIHKDGKYDIEYVVEDRSGNKNTYIKKVYVGEKEYKGTTIPASKNKVVYLTFDDGPSQNTAKVLDILKKYNVKATFFVTGNGKKYNYLIKRAHQEGHTIGLHTYSHDYSKVYASVDAYYNDLNKVGQMVKHEIGFVPHYIRFPGGGSNSISRKYTKGIMSFLTKDVQRRGYQYYDWNVSSGDASGNNVPVSKIVKNSTSSNSNNIMILAHDTGAKNTTVSALPKIIEYYQSKGYSFKGIDDSSFTPHHKVNN